LAVILNRAISVTNANEEYMNKYLFSLFNVYPSYFFKSELIIQSTDTIGNEVWNSYMGKVFFKELMLRFKALNDEYALQDKKVQNRILLFLQLHLATLSKDDLETLLNGIHKQDERVIQIINELVEGAMEQYQEIHKDMPEPTKNYGSGVDLGGDEKDDDFDFGDDDDDDDIY